MGNQRIYKSESSSGLSGPLIMMPVSAFEGSPSYLPPPHQASTETALERHQHDLLERLHGDVFGTYGMEIGLIEPTLSALAFSALLSRIQSARRMLLQSAMAASQNYAEEQQEQQQQEQEQPERENMAIVERIHNHGHGHNRLRVLGRRVLEDGATQTERVESDLSDTMARLIVIEAPTIASMQPNMLGGMYERVLNNNEEEQVLFDDGEGRQGEFDR